LKIDAIREMGIPVRVAAELDGVAVFNGGLGIHSAAASRANRNSRNFPCSFLDTFLGVEIVFHGTLGLGYLLGLLGKRCFRGAQNFGVVSRHL
jgi:hypothetical protein